MKLELLRTIKHTEDSMSVLLYLKEMNRIDNKVPTFKRVEMSSIKSRTTTKR